MGQYGALDVGSLGKRERWLFPGVVLKEGRRASGGRGDLREVDDITERCGGQVKAGDGRLPVGCRNERQGRR